MVDFPINVVIRPAKAVSGAQTINKQLSTVEASAKKLQKGLNDAFGGVRINQLRRDLTNTSVRISGATTQASKLKRTIADLNRQPLSRLQRNINTVNTGFRRLGRTAVSTLRNIKKEASGARIEVGGLGSAIGAIGAAAGIRSIINTGRSFQNLQRRILSVSESASVAESNFNLIKTVSDETGTSLENNAALFQRLTVATRNLGLDSSRTVGVLKTLNQALVLGGAGASEASAALTQLGQGLASGRLQGDELRSLLENAPLLAEKLAKQLGITTGELRELGAAGELTSDRLISALEGAAGEIDQAFQGLGPSLDQTFQRLENSVLELGASLQPFVENLSDSLGFITGIVQEAGKLVGIFRQLPGADRAQQASTGAASQTLINQLISRATFGSLTGITPRGAEGPNFANQAGQRSSRDIFEFESQKLGNQLGAFDPGADLAPQIAEFRRQLDEAGVSAKDLSAAVQALDATGGNLASTQRFVAQSLGLTISGLKNTTLSTKEVAAATTDLIDITQKKTLIEIQAAAIVAKAIAQEAVARRRLERAVKGQIQTLKDQARLIGIEGVAREALSQRIRAEANLRRKKLDINSAEAQIQLDIIEGLARENAERREAIRLQKEQEAARMADVERDETTRRRFGGGGDPGETPQDDVQKIETFTSRLNDANEAAMQLSVTFADTLVGGINASSDALAEFAISGARDFNALKEQLSSIFADIAKQILAAIIKALILRTITGILNPAAPAGGSTFQGFTGDIGGGAAFQGLSATGTATAHSGRSYTVNEGGREMFVSQSSNLSGWAASRRATNRTHSSRTRLGGRQAGGAVIPGGGALTGFVPPSAGQIIPAADTARLLNQERRGGGQTIVQAAAPKVEVTVTPMIDIGGEVIAAAIKNSDVVQTEIVSTVQKNQDGIRQAGRR